MARLSAEWLAEARDYIYHRTPQRRIQTLSAARSFVEETGFCHFWPNQGVEIPNLFHAIAGRIRTAPNEHDDPDISRCWGWKDEGLDKRWWHYGKLIRRRATLVSTQLLPAFYACSSNYGDMHHDYLDDYRDGRLSVESKNIYEALLENGPLHTIELRRQARMASDSAKYRFDKALTELQSGLKVLPVGVAHVGAWNYAFVYDIVARYYPDISEQARSISRHQAGRTLVSRYLQNVVAATRPEVKRTLDVLEWTPTEFDQVVGSLLREDVLREVPVEWASAPCLIPADMLEAAA